MRTQTKQLGFSLTEVLLATGILAMGFMLIALVFPAGMKLTAMAAEKTLAPVIAEEAAALVRLYGLDPAKLPAGPPSSPTYSVLFAPEYLADQSLRYFYKKYVDPDFDPINDPFPDPTDPANEAFFTALYDEIQKQLAADSMYPSLPADYFERNPDQKQRYGWTALCRRDPVFPAEADIRVFLYRRIEGLRYYGFTYDSAAAAFSTSQTDRPMPIPVQITAVAGSEQVTVQDGPAYPLQTNHLFFTEGTRLIADYDPSGFSYQVLQRKDNNSDGVFETLVLDKEYTGTNIVWVVPPPVGSGRNLCIDILK